jgi:hypothetical protein
LWEEAAAQGQTVLVSAGDSGSAACDAAGLFPAAEGIAVSGLSSTPWNVSVGGTDFYYSDYATGAASATNDWNQTNSSNLGSLKAPLTEQVWNDFLGLDVIELYPGALGDIAAGGGASSCVVSTTSTTFGTICNSGYPKPAWQTGTGVPADGVRDVPDVALFAADGANLSATPICAFEGECAAGAGNNVEVLLVGGTSASAPAMAGIMALVNQKYGRQGQADFVIYPLASQKPSAVHDVTFGSNNVNCFQGSFDCSLDTNGDGLYTLQKYDAAPGYDLASGLGSVDANVLVSNWNSITFLPTTTTLSLSSTKITHGTPITATSSVTPSSGTGTPSGGVAIRTSSTMPGNGGQGELTLSNGTASGSVNFFPGGFYNVYAQYGGDAVFGGSSSSPVALLVTPENSTLNFSVFSAQSQQPIASGGSIQYNVPITLVAQPVGVNASTGQTDGNPTGTATFTLDSTTETVALNANGTASWAPPELSLGSHTVSATYSGDSSFNASSASSVTVSVGKGIPYLTGFIITPPYGPPEPTYYNVPTGGSLTLGVEVGPYYGPITLSGAPFGTTGPTGTVTFCLDLYELTCNDPAYSQTVPLTPPTGNNSQYSSAAATFTNIQPGQFGEYFPAFQYNGDANWQGTGATFITVLAVGSYPTLAATTTNLSITPSSISGAETANFAITVTGTGNVSAAPSGWVYCYTAGVLTVDDFLTQGTSGKTSSVSFAINSSWFWSSGVNQLTCYYEGDNNYAPSTSNVASLTVTQFPGDFTLAPQQPQITVKSGSSGTVGLNLASLGSFNGVVTLTCTPSSSNITCSLNPSAPTVNGNAAATLTITAPAAQTALAARGSDPRGWRKTGGMLLAFLSLGTIAGWGCKRSRLPQLAVVALLLFLASCGGGGSSTTGGHQPPPSTTPYTVVVSGTAGGIVHSAKVIVLVQ